MHSIAFFCWKKKRIKCVTTQFSLEFYNFFYLLLHYALHDRTYHTNSDSAAYLSIYNFLKVHLNANNIIYSHYYFKSNNCKRAAAKKHDEINYFWLWFKWKRKEERKKKAKQLEIIVIMWIAFCLLHHTKQDIYEEVKRDEIKRLVQWK